MWGASSWPGCDPELELGAFRCQKEPWPSSPSPCRCWGTKGDNTPSEEALRGLRLEGAGEVGPALVGMGGDEGGPLAGWYAQVGEQYAPQTQTLPHGWSSVKSKNGGN